MPSPALGTLAVSDIEAMGVDNRNFCPADSGNFSAKQGRPPGQSRRSRNALGALAGWWRSATRQRGLSSSPIRDHNKKAAS